ncbi:MAG: transcriptional repressor [Prosthecochloris sp.]|nr:Fur family transcriptional regulator [Prosthecochloris sp.]MCW8798196.1 transcriptional repressor [Prosthecochloris sp.]
MGFLLSGFLPPEILEEEMCMSDEYTKELIKQFIERCRAHSLKITPQRLAIYRELLKLQVHPSADAVYKNMVRDFPTISFDTVNRTLLTFAEIGVVETVESHSGVRRFETDLEPHHHLHCIKCGEIIDFCDSDLDAVEVPERIADEFTVIGKRVVIRGICRKCAEKDEDGEKTQPSKGKSQKAMPFAEV